MTAFQPGDLIGQTYRVLWARPGRVTDLYHCQHVRTGQERALKTLRDAYLADRGAHGAFLAAAASWAGLEVHANIRRLYDFETWSGRPFLVLDWVSNDDRRGADLGGWMLAGALQPRVALDFAVEVCRGLIHCTRKQPGFVHGDLKPEHVLIDRLGQARLTDFGIADVIPAATPALRGTPSYRVPEQWRGEKPDARTDVYGVGCLLFAMLTGTPPFSADSAEGLRQQHLEASVPPVGATVLSCEDDLAAGVRDLLWPNRRHQETPIDHILARCLTKSRDGRFASVAELLQAIDLLYRERFGYAPRPLVTYEEFVLLEDRARPHAVVALERFGGLDYFARANVYFRVGRPDLAVPDCDHLIGHTEDLEGMSPAVAHSLRGLSYAKLGRGEEAREDLDHAIALMPEAPEWYFNRAQASFLLGRNHEANDDLTRCLQLAPDNGEAYYWRAVSRASLRQYDGARADLEELRRRDPEYADLPPVLLLRGVVHNALGEAEQALTALSRCLERDATLVEAHFERGEALTALGRWAEALDDFRAAARSAPEAGRAHQRCGDCLAQLGRDGEAVASYDEAARLNPGAWAPVAARAGVLERLGRAAEAEQAYRKALALNPESGWTCLRLGSLLLRQGAAREAEPLLTRAAELGAFADDSAPQTGMDGDVLWALIAMHTASSFEDVRAAAEHHPLLTIPDVLALLQEPSFQERMPAALRPAWKQRLVWLRQIAAGTSPPSPSG
jgi:tetratricopeptide (TPR) repeat protein